LIVSTREALWVLVLMSALTLYSGVTISARMRQQLRRHWNRQPFSEAQTHVTINVEGVRTDSWTGYAMRRWHGFTHYRETPAAFLLFRGPEDMQLIPKRAFADESQIIHCRQLLEQHIGRTTYARPV